ncbi:MULTISPECIES: DUF547 domain-containing protein [unclassified Pseudomonas]|uniref:DUF547 domain-containing protein n=1 Tax=unclassified Pseudomonas TaxID=196821 RepID=UPI001C499A22|nr:MULTISPECIES: DUF547 domain-containing protein [unclassified Pseudomonas]
MRLLRQLTAIFLILLAGSVSAAPAAERWAVWDVSNESRAAHIDHSAWQELLTRYLNSQHPSGIARFDYAHVDRRHRRLLDVYVEQLSALDPRQFTRAEQLAYWLNLYNALIVQQVLKNYPVDSITSLGAWYQFGPWDKAVTEVAGYKLSLNDIEHRILRPLWRDPRLHYALNCASLGCPNLAAETYSAQNSERLLEAGARAYINHPRGVAFEDGKWVLSRIYDWYPQDFGGEEGLRAHLIHYANPALAQQLQAFTGKPRYRYDWNLNQP